LNNSYKKTFDEEDIDLLEYVLEEYTYGGEHPRTSGGSVGRRRSGKDSKGIEANGDAKKLCS